MKQHKSWHVKSAFGGRKKMRVGGKAIEDLTPKELGFHAITHTSPMHQVALIAELVSRIDPTIVAPMLRSIPVERKSRPKNSCPSPSPVKESDKDEV